MKIEIHELARVRVSDDDGLTWIDAADIAMHAEGGDDGCTVRLKLKLVRRRRRIRGRAFGRRLATRLPDLHAFLSGERSLKTRTRIV